MIPLWEIAKSLKRKVVMPKQDLSTFLQIYAELAEHDGCPEEVARLYAAVSEIERLRSFLENGRVAAERLPYNVPLHNLTRDEFLERCRSIEAKG